MAIIIQFIKEYIKEEYQQIEDVELLEQLRDFSYENKGSFDLIATMGMCEIAHQDKVEIPIEVKVTNYERIGWYVDNKGHKKYGAIPQNIKEKLLHTFGT